MIQYALRTEFSNDVRCICDVVFSTNYDCIVRCCLRITKKQPPVEFEVVDHLGEIDRDGFGSTGIQ